MFLCVSSKGPALICVSLMMCSCLFVVCIVSQGWAHSKPWFPASFHNGPATRAGGRGGGDHSMYNKSFRFSVILLYVAQATNVL